MQQNQWVFPLSKSTPSLQWQEPLLDGRPAPAGTLFVLSAYGGYAAVPHERNELSFGREQGKVNVVVGANDQGVSRRHATIRCTAQGDAIWWTLRNEGRRPIELPPAPPLLQHLETPLADGFTRLYVGSERRHAVEVLVSKARSERSVDPVEGRTRDGRIPLAPNERLALVAMFQDYLHRSSSARPLTRNEARDALNQVPGQSGWTDKKVEHTVAGVRKKLSSAELPGLDIESAHPDVIRVNLIKYLLDTGSLVPNDLRLLDGPRRQ